VYYTPGSLKARLCVEGAKLMYEFCDEHDIRYERCGKLIVALEVKELFGLDELERRGIANGVSGLRRLTSSEIAEVEPGCLGIGALHSPGTGIVNYYEVAKAIERELQRDGVHVHFGARVERFERDGAETELICHDRSFRAQFVIGCAGLWSDRLAVSAGASPDPQIVPFRGAYLTLKASPTPVVRGLVYPVPDPSLPFLGVHVTKLINGDITLGPTAMLVPARDAYRLGRLRPRDLWDTLRWPGTWKMSRKFWRSGVSEVMTSVGQRRLVGVAERYVPAVSTVGVKRERSSGVRAQALSREGVLLDDFVISETVGAVHVRNAPSPAATSSLALAKEVIGRVEASSQWPFH
jgi:L-2-hydroxyglutarate oxidase LhgO